MTWLGFAQAADGQPPVNHPFSPGNQIIVDAEDEPQPSTLNSDHEGFLDDRSGDGSERQ